MKQQTIIRRTAVTFLRTYYTELFYCSNLKIMNQERNGEGLALQYDLFVHYLGYYSILQGIKKENIIKIWKIYLQICRMDYNPKVINDMGFNELGNMHERYKVATLLSVRLANLSAPQDYILMTPGSKLALSYYDKDYVAFKNRITQFKEQLGEEWVMLNEIVAADAASIESIFKTNLTDLEKIRENILLIKYLEQLTIQAKTDRQWISHLNPWERY
jgi:hypothetical protein